MKELECRNNSSGTSSPFIKTDCLGKLFKGIKIARQRVWENQSRGTKSPDKATGCLEKLLWTKTEKQSSVKSCTKSPKRETPPIYGNCSSLTKKGKVVHKKQVCCGWNRIKAATCYSENSFFKNLPQQQQHASCSYQRSQPLVKFFNKTCLRSDFSTQPLSKLKNF